MLICDGGKTRAPRQIQHQQGEITEAAVLTSGLAKRMEWLNYCCWPSTRGKEAVVSIEMEAVTILDTGPWPVVSDVLWSSS